MDCFCSTSNVDAANDAAYAVCDCPLHLLLLCCVIVAANAKGNRKQQMLQLLSQQLKTKARNKTQI